MEKSIYSDEYAVFLARLREAREEKGLTQTELGERLGQTQSFISKVERGERRIDVVELRAFCQSIGVPFISFLKAVDVGLEEAVSLETKRQRLEKQTPAKSHEHLGRHSKSRRS